MRSLDRLRAFLRPRPEQVYVRLIAVEVNARSEKEASERLVGFLACSGIITHEGSPFDSWWEADDVRTDRSDSDSAVFVRPGYQRVASMMIEDAGFGEL